MKRLLLTTLITALLAGCGTPAGSPLGAKLTLGQAPAARPALVSVAAPTSRVLAEGAFTLPASLVSIGSGGLVSIGSGGLVSIGSGGLVSIGSGGYKVLAVLDGGAAAQRREGAPDVVAIPGALITLARARGEAIDAAFEVAPAQSDADGRYRLHGRAPAGLYRVAASIGGHTFMTLVALTSDTAAQAPIDAATTLVTARLLAENPTGDLSVLPMQAYGETVAAVRAALAADSLPAGWTPDRAAATMAELERRVPAIAGAMKRLRERRAGLEHREDAFGYHLQELAASLGVPAELVVSELQAVLSVAPEASDAEIDAEITSAVRRRTEPTDAPSPDSEAGTAPGGETSPPTSGEMPTPSTDETTTSPADTPATAPTGEAAGAPAGGTPAAAAPAHAPAEGATEDDEAVDHKMANDDRRAQGKTKHQPTPAPSAAPTDAPADDEPSDPPSETPDDTPSTEPPPDETAGGDDGADDETGTAGGTGDNAGGNGNNAGGNADNAGGNGNNAGGNGNNAGGNGNGNANGQNGTQGQGNGGSNNGNGGATNGTGNH